MQTFDEVTSDTTPKVPWKKGKLLGSKPPLQTKQVWVEHRLRDLAMFNLAIDSKLRESLTIARQLLRANQKPHGSKAPQWRSRLDGLNSD